MDSILNVFHSSLQFFSEHWEKQKHWLTILGAVMVPILIIAMEAHAQVRIPGQDESQKLQAAGTLLRLVDTALFVWLARIFAGLCILSSGWLIKEQKFGPAVICVIGAFIIGTSPLWVVNIFDVGGGGGVFN